MSLESGGPKIKFYILLFDDDEIKFFEENICENFP